MGLFRVPTEKSVRGLYLSTGTDRVQTPDAASLDITSDLELVMQVARDDWTSGNLVFFSKRSAAEGLSWQWGIGTNGDLLFAVRTGATDYFGAATGSNPGFVDGTMYWLRLRRTATSGAVTMSYAADQDDEPSNWTSITVGGTQQSGSLDANNAPIEIGGSRDGTAAMDGTYRRAIIRDGIDGTTVADWRGDLPANPFRDSTGKIWTIGGTSAWAWEAA